MKQKYAAKLWKRALSTGLSLAMAVTMIPSVGIQAAAKDASTLNSAGTTVPADNITQNQPFIAGSTGDKFSSPTLVIRQAVKTLGTGNEETDPTVGAAITDDLIIAAAEVSHVSTEDDTGNDIMVSVSSDQGKTWKHSYPLSFPDSEVEDNATNAVSVKDPVLLQDTKLTIGNNNVGYVSGGTVYLLANLMPNGVGVEEDSKYPGAGTGYVDIGGTKRLALTTEDSETDKNPTAENANYPYYVGDFDDAGYAAVYVKDGNQIANIEGKTYYVDKYYDLYEGNDHTPVASALSDDLQDNVFYEDSVLSVYNTNYIVCMTSSYSSGSEEGDEWTEPEILTPQLDQREDELLMLVSGKGLVTTANRYIVPIYTKEETEETELRDVDAKAGIIWKSDSCEHATAGSPWGHRAEVPAFTDASATTSNWMWGGEMVETSRGIIRMFLTTGRGVVYYADASRGETVTDEDGESVSDDTSTSPDMFTFSAPVETESSITANAKVAAIAYSRTMNAGDSNSDITSAIMAAMPTGTGNTDGMFVLYGRDKEATEDVAFPAMMELYTESLTSGNFASASMGEMNYGSNIGILWETGRGTVSFENYQTLDLINNDENGDGAYVPGLEYNLELRPNGDTYTRTYRVTGETNMEPEEREFNTDETKDYLDITLDRGTAKAETMPSLFSRKVTYNSTEQVNLAGAFENTYDSLTSILHAEFTLTRPTYDGTASNVFSVYSQVANRYLTNYNAAAAFFSTTLRNNMRIRWDESRSAFLVSQPLNADENETSGTRYVIYDTYRHTFNTNSGLQSDSRYMYGLTLLKKLSADEVAAMKEDDSDSDIINFGSADSTDYCYIKVTGDEGLESRRKYLIGYEVGSTDQTAPFAEGGFVALYPDNGVDNMAKLIYGTHLAETQKIPTLTIKPKAATTETIDLTINNITYHINVKPETITVPKGGATFVEGAALNAVDLGDASVLSKATTTELKKALFDCLSESSYNLNGYATTPNWNANIADAELILTSASANNPNYFYIYSPLERNYLINTNASSYFGTTRSIQELNPVNNGTDGTDNAKYPYDTSFEIIKRDSGTQNGRIVYFYYNRMAFDALSAKNSDYESQGDWGFEILRKKDSDEESLDDPIPGYERVSEITSGDTYLITNYYKQPATDTSAEKEVIIVLYPRNGITNQSKMYATTEVSGVKISASAEANEGDTFNITIGEDEYIVEIEAECLHGYSKTKTATASTCKVAGSTGDVICSHCQKVLVKGEALPLEDHDWPDEWQEVRAASINRTAKTVTDGLESRVCSGGEEFEERAISGEALLLQTITDAIATAAAEKEKTTLYAAETIKALDDAIIAATAAVSGQTPTTLEDKFDALAGLEDAVKPANLITQDAYNTRKDELDLLLVPALENKDKTDIYTKDSLDALNAALADIEAMEKDENGNLSYADMLTAINKLKDAPLKTKAEAEEEAKAEALIKSIQTALETADSIASVAANKDKYTEDSWNKFISAYNALKNKSEAELKALGSAELERLLADLTAKLVEKPITTNPVNQLQANKDYTVGSIVYTVTDAAKNEVTVKKGTNAKKVTIPATVTIENVSCKVVAIGDKAFSGCKKLKNITIGENVRSIGANAFLKCTKLKTVTINGATAPTIKKAAFKKTASKITVKAKKLNKKQKKAFLKVLKKTGKISKKAKVK